VAHKRLVPRSDPSRVPCRRAGVRARACSTFYFPAKEDVDLEVACCDSPPRRKEEDCCCSLRETD